MPGRDPIDTAVTYAKICTIDHRISVAIPVVTVSTVQPVEEVADTHPTSVSSSAPRVSSVTVVVVRYYSKINT